MIAKVISGGQTGVDLAALRAAKAAGLPTGGYAPKGWLTEAGPAPWLGGDYGLTEMPTPSYPARTRKNIDAAHATLIVNPKPLLTGGTRLTYDHAYRAGQRGAGLYVTVLTAPDLGDCLRWVRECVGGRADWVLNVAGPRESGSPGIGKHAEDFLADLFRECLQPA